MANKKNKRNLLFIVVAVALIGAVVFIAYSLRNAPTPTASSQESSEKTSQPTQQEAPAPEEAYKGERVSVGTSFSIKVPNGWRASISNSPSFIAIMFARPNQIDSLKYNASSNPPIIDQDGIPAWDGLTEHFFVRIAAASQKFNPSDHLEITSEPFSFDNGLIGTKYYVVKHADEAQKWGGLQKDSEWQGRTYIYEKDSKQLEAHLAMYPSTAISVPFYESVVRTLQLN